jgi:hypothetical protein
MMAPLGEQGAMNIRAVFRAGITFFGKVIPAGTIIPGTPPRDRIDRILIANAPPTLVTREREIFDYASRGLSAC